MNKFWKIYESAVRLLLLLYLCGMMSLWRAFSIMHIRVAGQRIFITELMLIFSLPFIIKNIRKILIIPRTLLFVLTLYFITGAIYLFCALVINKNLFAIRDIVLFAYILFLPLSLFVFADKNNLRFMFYFVILSNLVSIFIVRSLMFNGCIPVFFLRGIIYNTRLFNYGLFFGMIIPIYYALIIKLSKNASKYFLILLLSINIYTILMIGERSVWLSFTLLIIFLFLSFKIKAHDLLITFIFLVSVVSLLFYFDSKLIRSTAHYSEVTLKAHSLRIIMTELNRKPQAQAGLIPKNLLYDAGNQAQPSKITPNDKIAGVKQVPNTQDKIRHSVAGSLFKYFDHLRRVSEPEYRTVLDNLFWRLIIWKQAVNFGTKSPILGRGFGVTPDYKVWSIYTMPLVKGLGVDSNIMPAHNHLITIFIKMGLLGFFLFLFINIYIYWFAFRQIGGRVLSLSQYLLLGFLGAFIFWHVLALFFNVIESPPTSIFLWVITGFMFACIKLTREDFPKEV